MSKALLAAALCMAAPALVAAQNSAPHPLPIVSTVPVARDVPFPGVVRLDVDATDTARAIFRVRETIPVRGPGPLTLLLPNWLPGHHGPDGQADKVMGFEFSAGGRRLAWRRDPLDTNAFHIDVPAGTSEVEARFNYLSPTAANQGRITMTPAIAHVQWELVSLYPAGYYTRRIPVVASLTLPAGWQAGTALQQASRTAAPNRITYGEVSYETLQDSPVFAGRHFRSDPLGHGAFLDSVADEAKELAIPAAVLAKHRAMVDQTVKLFGARHYDHYRFLNAVSDKLGGIGLEHHRSTEITSDPGYYTDYANHLFDRNVFPHEFVHSWNGKFRRPADLFTPDFRMPMRNSLLWVYEGQTQFWGHVVEVRSGMSSKQDVLDRLALTAAGLDNQRGRLWRPLIDTTNDPIIQNRRPQPWGSFQRNEDYYNEGMLIWIEADAIIREGSRGRRSMDDFARAFFGIRPGDWGVVPYTRSDVVATLQRIHPYDWSGFFAQRVDAVNPRAPLAGFTRSGYELRYAEEPTPAAIARAKLNETADFAYSLGFTVNKERKLASVLWGSPAFDASLRIGDEIVAVGERTYSEDWLKEAIRAGKDGAPVRLIVKRGDAVRTIDIPYRGGLRYPRFVKARPGKGALDRLLEPR
jgi:predicted metalloprotease with PDZ domain